MPRAPSTSATPSPHTGPTHLPPSARRSRAAAAGLHLVDEGFGATLLLVCALASRFTDNPAVLPPGNSSWQWAGWHWFEQVHAARRLIPLAATTLYDLQVATVNLLSLCVPCVC